ncbi:ArsR family transcriptional regulator [Sulfobacillus thermosulfidooxidans DSM 9293]|uniref:ArsR family transcriptional regulator n=2 Tax=Sulfobacillus thermosulfidooxidans TaxID=28034 RepID=A0A1W1WLK4_SULTA|nr:metalloregulator ArsR/SmtB family transcription factor [Sulfobacillus thermosulfidooxidans]PSR25209.1 MAG: ArsR family transcriptional regulator [Sulfobacillus thermosulfidooxidans]SMC07059.1 ArsR family transcriptional regulator [Sulfobacillus thermosulfidooxidans DSM 9293]
MTEPSHRASIIQSSISFDRALKVLSDPTRLEIMRLLGNSGELCCRTVPMDSDHQEVGLCVQDLVTHMKLPQSTVSHHLGMLRNVGLVTTYKDGACVYYIRNDQALNAIKSELNKL